MVGEWLVCAPLAPGVPPGLVCDLREEPACCGHSQQCVCRRPGQDWVSSGAPRILAK